MTTIDITAIINRKTGKILIVPTAQADDLTMFPSMVAVDLRLPVPEGIVITEHLVVKLPGVDAEDYGKGYVDEAFDAIKAAFPDVELRLQQ